MSKLIGNTPMIKIEYEINGIKKEIFTKLEYYNFTGSIKDRMAYYILKKAKKEGVLRENQAIIEATSGNTGISFAALGALYKHPVYIFMPDWVSSERQKLLKSYGAKVNLVSKKEGGFLKCIEAADELADKLNGFRPNQFANKLNVEAHYLETAEEIISDMSNNKVDCFISGVGTGGTLMGIGNKLKLYDEKIKICALEPTGLPLMSSGVSEGEHKIEGIGDDFIPEIVDKDIIDEIILINDNDAINMSRRLSRELGIGVGISSGANMLGAVMMREKINGNVVTVFPDDNKKYMSTELINDIDYNKEFLSNKIKLLGVRIMD